MFGGKRFCDISPTTYKISTQKERIKRHLQNLTSKEKIAKTHRHEKLPNLVASQSSHMIKHGPGIDPKLQENKAVNIRLCSAPMNEMIIHPGETFSFWLTSGNTTKRKGYMDGRIIENDELKPGIGGGLCNLANTLHRLILHSPLDVTEFHSHSDALNPDEGPRVPFATGTSVSYNYIDYRFKNNTDQDFQLLLWTEGDNLYGELRSEREIPFTYELAEEGHHFQQEDNGKYYRVSKIYRLTRDRETGEVVDKKLVLDNHSEVMYDPQYIPAELLWETAS